MTEMERTKYLKQFKGRARFYVVEIFGTCDEERLSTFFETLTVEFGIEYLDDVELKSYVCLLY